MAKMWHREIKKDLNKIIDMVDFFEIELEQARKELKESGIIENVLQRLPAYFEIRFAQLQELEAVMELLEIDQKKRESEAYIKFLEHYKRALSSSDVKRYIESDKAVVEIAELINEVAFIRNQYHGVVKSLEMKSFQLGHVVKLRTAGIEDATLG